MNDCFAEEVKCSITTRIRFNVTEFHRLMMMVGEFRRRFTSWSCSHRIRRSRRSRRRSTAARVRRSTAAAAAAADTAASCRLLLLVSCRRCVRSACRRRDALRQSLCQRLTASRTCANTRCCFQLHLPRTTFINFTKLGVAMLGKTLQTLQLTILHCLLKFPR